MRPDAMEEFGSGIQQAVLAGGSASGRLAEDVRWGLSQPRKQLHSQYLYDSLGSRLFEAICALPEYRVTQAEQKLLDRYSNLIVSDLEGPVTLVELGPGSGEKLAQLIEPLLRNNIGVNVELVDISEAALDLATRTLTRFPSVPVFCHEAVYLDGLQRSIKRRHDAGSLLVAFLGSSLGNFAPSSAHTFLSNIQTVLRAGDRFLLGLDLVKPEQELTLAYDDPLGVTAAFNRNILVRLNRELAADFDLEWFGHRVIWNFASSSIEMYLESLCEQKVSIPGADCQIRFKEGEYIWTESSYKYTTSQIVSAGMESGFATRGQWVDEEVKFAVTAFEVL